MASQDFQQQLVLLMPKLRVWALAFTRDSSAAADLVQDVAAKALAASNSFEPGTNFGAWMRRIMVNHFLSGMRRQRECADKAAIPELSVAAVHEDRIALRELSGGFNHLSADQKEALSLIALNEESYERASEITGCAIGTLKSRVHRARLQLRSYRDGSSKAAV